MYIMDAFLKVNFTQMQKEGYESWLLKLGSFLLLAFGFGWHRQRNCHSSRLRRDSVLHLTTAIIVILFELLALFVSKHDWAVVRVAVIEHESQIVIDLLKTTVLS